MTIASEILDHYAKTAEKDRLSAGAGLVERARTGEMLCRHLPPPPARVLDVGGAAGVHALPLAQAGYEVHLVDPVPRHVREAKEASARQSGRPLSSVREGDARSLQEADATVDAVLLLGPLYHLSERADRLAALADRRVVPRRERSPPCRGPEASSIGRLPVRTRNEKRTRRTVPGGMCVREAPVPMLCA